MISSNWLQGGNIQKKKKSLIKMCNLIEFLQAKKQKVKSKNSRIKKWRKILDVSSNFYTLQKDIRILLLSLSKKIIVLNKFQEFKLTMKIFLKIFNLNFANLNDLNKKNI